MATETELKLSIAAEDVGKLARSALLAAATRSKPTTRTVYSVYYDTPEHDLANRGMALRLRKAAGRWVQTLKTAGTAQAGLHERGEFEAPAAAQLLNVVALAATPAAEIFADAALRGRLQPLFITEFKRTSRLVEIHPGELAELCVDRGTITGNAQQVPISEIELELKQGEASHLFDFAQRLLVDVPLVLSNVSKAERGYALLAPQGAAASKAQAPLLDATMSVPEAFRVVIGEGLRHLQANERGVVSSDDVEYVHQARVAIRRLRSAFGLFRRVVPKPAVGPLLDRVKALGTVLGGTRDWDVFVTETLPAVVKAFPDHSGFATLRTSAERSRGAARERVLATITAADYTALLLELGSLLASQSWRASLDEDARTLESMPIEGFVATVLERQWRRVRRAGKHCSDLAPPQLHALRIEIKKLRYAVEFFQALHARKAVKAFLDQAAELQEILGTMNDATIASHLLDTMAADKRPAAEATGILRGWVAARSQQGLAHLETAWKHFEDARPYW